MTVNVFFIVQPDSSRKKKDLTESRDPAQELRTELELFYDLIHLLRLHLCDAAASTDHAMQDG